MHRLLLGAFRLCMALAAATWVSHGAKAQPVIAAASDLTTTLPEIAALFAKETGRSVRLVFGASGSLAQQILSGAPFEMFLSADESYAHRVYAAGRTLDSGAVYAIGRIGLFASGRAPFAADSLLTGLSRALAGGRVRKFAIASPDHAPYGRAAKQALERANLLGVISSHLVFGENVSQAVQFATAGGADGGILPASLAGVLARNDGSFALIPATWHAPLRQRAVVMTHASPTARAFMLFLLGDAARAVLARHGFELPPRGTH